MYSVNSLSGGKSSSYMYVNNPADLELFSVVCIEDHNANGRFWRDNKSLLNYVNDKLQSTCPQFGTFKATAEDPITLRAMYELEQKVGREITWVRGESFETVLNTKRAIPNQRMRFCTTETKIVPIYNYIKSLNLTEEVDMRIGFRYDEMSRVVKQFFSLKAAKKNQQLRLLTDYDMLLDCLVDNDELRAAVTRILDLSDTLTKNNTGKIMLKPSLPSQFKGEEWRKLNYPLITDKVTNIQVAEQFKQLGITFPDDSNCQFCFHKQEQQLRKNFDTNKPILQWASIMEVLQGRRFKTSMNLLSIQKIGLQQELFFGGGSGCDGGFCTD